MSEYIGSHNLKTVLIKTPLHLIPIYSAQGGSVWDRAIRGGAVGYSKVYTPQIARFWQEAKLIGLKHITYNSLLPLLGNFQRLDKISGPNEFSIKGDIVSLWPIGYEKPVRLEFFGQKLENAYRYDELYGRSLESVEYLLISSFHLNEEFDRKQIFINHKINHDSSIAIIFSNSLPEQMVVEPDEIIETDYAYPQLFFNRFDLLEKEIERLANLNYKIAIISKNGADLPKNLQRYLIKEDSAFDIPTKVLTQLPAGFESSSKKQLFLTDREIFGTIHLAKQSGEASSKTLRILRQLEQDISIGEYVVHEDYGVGIYRGLKQEKTGDVSEEYLLVEYAKGDQLFIPISQVSKLSKYINDTSTAPNLTRLGIKEWESIKQKVKKSVGILARELVNHYAKRMIAKASIIDAKDSKEFEAFCEKFAYPLTADQHRSTNEILNDLVQTKPMDRLLIGDVGFGKTEVFLRAAFKICETGKQVAILCPTTVLAAQHFALCQKRFAGTKFKIGSLSRFNTSKENRAIVDQVNSGELQIVVGTHRLLSNDVKFKDLGLLIVDEEQKFGVKQKEKIRKINYGVHTLSVTATPIPRTLSMALSTIQDISIISTPPENRQSVKTELVNNDWNQITKAIEFEIKRDGQVYFIHNQVQTIQSIVARLEQLLPGISFIYAHGQMPNNQLDKVITDFYLGKFQVLVASTIIENGIDMPNVNTMIINQAHRFGLAQLYQLRGRVGRSEKQAYCYLFTEKRKSANNEGEQTFVHLPSDEKQDKKTKRIDLSLERIQTILNSTDLGSGFKIASKDLEIRGAGNLLGDQQSGHINTVGYSLYMQMLSTEIEKLQEGLDQGVVSF